MKQTEKPMVSVSFDLNSEARAVLEASLGSVADIRYLREVDSQERAKLLQTSKAVLAWFPSLEFSEADIEKLGNIGMMQLLSAGADHVDFTRLPAGLTIASNVGAYARPMAEHTLAMALALSKRLFFHHQQLRLGVFDQLSENKEIYGSTAAILGFGGIGKEVARLFRVFNTRILAINSSGETSEPVDFVGTLADMDRVLPEADIIVISLPLNRMTRGCIGERELKLMKPDAVLVNVGRGEIIDEEAFYRHLVENPTFMAGIDAWWTEPARHGRFEIHYPFLDLPNVIGTPHNSALVPGSLAAAVQKAADNIKRFLLSEPITGVVRREEYT